MKLLLIANPVSGRRRALRRRQRLEAILAARGHEVTTRITRAAGDAARFAALRPPDLDRIVVAGGDGTLNEVLNGLGERLGPPIVQLPSGTANILAHEYGLPGDPEAVADLVEGGVVRHLDLGVIGERRFLLLASCGFDAMVTRAIRRRRSGALGYRGYLRPIFETLWRYREPQLFVRIDAGEELPAALVVVSNTRNYGGLFCVTDRARGDSGQLDVCLFARASRRHLVRYAWAGFRGRIARLDGVLYRTGRRIAIRSAEPVPVEVDGDDYADTPVEIRVVPRAVPIVMPPARG
ncbi:MAG: diacylglycerol kinase family lipid kinase [Deltaproteobacteria bacterium]|nr:MAG: diacylglycerol kinase family lipid kinase [Deltaproteobacteria bacterium]